MTPPASPLSFLQRSARVVWLALACCGGAALAQQPADAGKAARPGHGVKVQPVKSAIPEETFQTLLVARALEQLGYDVQPYQEADYTAAYLAVGNGDATFLAVYWNPYHKVFYDRAGGDAKLFRQGKYTSDAAQGYLIDKKTADAHNITNIAQLREAAIAKLFDADGDGKADLTGCDPGWGCERILEHHLDAFGLRASVKHHQGNYAALMADTIARYRAGQPIFYYTWTPYWVSGVLRPGRDVVWLEVPFSASPEENATLDTTAPNGKNYGFAPSHMQIVAHRVFAEKHPDAAKLFAIMHLPVDDISAQNSLMNQGQNTPADIARHTDAWIRAHQATFDGWIAQARAAAR